MCPERKWWRNLLTGNVASDSWRLQVTTRLSQQCGRQMWGFPKQIADLEFPQRDGEAHWRLRMDGRDLFHFFTKASGSRTPAPITSSVYSIYQGTQQVSPLSQFYRETGYSLGGARIELG